MQKFVFMDLLPAFFKVNLKLMVQTEVLQYLKAYAPILEKSL